MSNGADRRGPSALGLKDLVDRRAFTLAGHARAKECGHGGGDVNLADDAAGGIALLEAFSGGDEDGRYRRVIIAVGGGQAVAVNAVVAFLNEVNKVAAAFAV